ncbi:FAD dependent oxidoreductase [Catenulispora acidiphila DSM 44928]|uniref:Glycerol-3-phosphate dehydrogenase n=1 Tax=Catenulispora acidiphila (strain DSM 44928 / JCM 14897 / NBRC 102108 / NRRL B-24433 / ID139908) TaxID=479433 RepID=C7Q534_CATAD|nr:glycerol-3-phosphate dehydrogenase [Catenulispora acidiphila]ACU73982.1 FAD dependent oxidoreductase [Catenulispora acidiphila DSM 44928]
MQSTPLGAQYRLGALQQMAEEEFDVLVIGGGVVGAGAALDAATRGLSVALVEARDWAAGTSSRSSKLIHGGLRYLEQRDFGLVREALTERSLLLNRIAPHLVRPVPFLLPLRHRVWERFYIGAGVLLYDTMGGARTLPRHRHLSKTAALRRAPALRSDSLTGAIQYYDAQVDDARFVMALARTAAQYGARVATRTKVTGLLREGGRVTGAVVRDLEGGGSIEVRARQVVAATGVWTDDIHELAQLRASISVRASKGVHLVVPRDRIDLRTGLISRTEKSVLFIIPWGRHWLVGTTDTDWDLDREHPAASRADIEYLLEHANAVLAKPLTEEDIEGVYVGLRPLLSGTADQTTKLSREHVVASPAPGLVVVAGGKYTTYRVMAKDAIDAAVEDLGTADEAKIPDSVTDKVPVLGAEGFAARWNERARIARRTGLHQVRVEHLLRRYGTCVEELLELIAADKSLGDPIAGADDYLRVEAVYAASHEGALHLEDVLTRRTRISIEAFDRGVAAAPEVAALMAPVLGWSEATVREEVERYRGRVEAERASQAREDDAEADAVRRAAPDLDDGARGGGGAGAAGAADAREVDAASCGAAASEKQR